MNSTNYEMTSDLVARTTENYRDAFVFQMEGLQGPASDAVRHADGFILMDIAN